MIDNLFFQFFHELFRLKLFKAGIFSFISLLLNIMNIHFFLTDIAKLLNYE